MRIKTREQLREYIKRKLGHPLINVELTDDMLNDCIDRALEIYSEYAYDGQSTGSILLDLSNLESNNMPLEITLPDNVIAITGASTYSSNNSVKFSSMGVNIGDYSLDINSSKSFSSSSMIAQLSNMNSISSMFTKSINFDYNYNSKILKFFEKPDNNHILLEVGLDYEPMEVDNIYNNQWIKKRAEGEAWVQWSSVMGKYTGTLVNGSEINYSDMLSKGETLIDRSEEELEGLFEPLGIWIF